MHSLNTKAHLLWFVQQDDELLIGVYETDDDPKNAIVRLKSKPDFIDFPQGFEIHSYELGKDHWTEGFIRD